MVNNGILINFPTPSGLAGTLSGSATLTPLQLMYLVTGQTYANIHTTNFPAGEIRGQLYPGN